MAKQLLPTNFVDDILASSMGGKRKFTITDNGDGTYEIEDVTDYTQTGSDFGSGQINAMNQAVNESCDKANVIETMDDIMANQASGMIAGAKAVAELNGKSDYEEVTDDYNGIGGWYGRKYANGWFELWGEHSATFAGTSEQIFVVNFPFSIKRIKYAGIVPVHNSWAVERTYCYNTRTETSALHFAVICNEGTHKQYILNSHIVGWWKQG